MGFTADRLLLFGATGDLSQRMLLPSLCALHADDLLAPDLKIVGTARSEMTTAEFRNFAREALEKHLPAGRRGGVGTPRVRGRAQGGAEPTCAAALRAAADGAELREAHALSAVSVAALGEGFHGVHQDGKRL